MHNYVPLAEWSIREKAPNADIPALQYSLRKRFATIRHEGQGSGFTRGSNQELTVSLTSVADHKAIREIIEMSGFEIIPQSTLVHTQVPANLSQTLSPEK